MQKYCKKTKQTKTKRLNQLNEKKDTFATYSIMALIKTLGVAKKIKTQGERLRGGQKCRRIKEQRAEPQIQYRGMSY